MSRVARHGSRDLEHDPADPNAVLGRIRARSPLLPGQQPQQHAPPQPAGPPPRPLTRAEVAAQLPRNTPVVDEDDDNEGRASPSVREGFMVRWGGSLIAKV